MISRRTFLKAASLLALCPTGCVRTLSRHDGVLVNDVHAQLNPTRVDRIVSADSLKAIHNAIALARRGGKAVCIAGGRHAMGAQQFATDAVLLDTKRLNRVLHFDPSRGTIEVEAGIQWPELVGHLLDAQRDASR